MNLQRFLGNNEEKIEKLKKYFQEKDENALIDYSAHSKRTLGHLSDENLIETRRIRGTIVSETCDKIVEYSKLTGEEDIPFYAKRFLKINGKFVNLINGELACRKYFNPDNINYIIND